MTAIPLSPPRVAPPVGTPPGGASISLPRAQVEPVPQAHLAPPVAATREDASVRVLLVEELQKMADHIGDLLRKPEHVHLLETVTDGRFVLDRIHELRPDVLIIDALLQGTHNGLQIARLVRTSGISIPIILMTVPDHPVILTADMGIAEVLTIPLDGNELLGSIVRTDEAHRGPAPLRASGTFVVYSGKGGVGRTTIAYDLAVTLSRSRDTRVVLVDGDFQHGDLRLHLNVPDTAPSILQLPTGRVTEDDLAPVLWRDPAGVDVLLAPPRLEEADLITQIDVENSLALLRRLYDVVVIDAPAAMNDLTLAMLDSADVLVGIVVPERGAVHKARRSQQVLMAAGYPTEKIVTVLNRSQATGPWVETVSAALGRAPDVILPEEPWYATGGMDRGQSVVVAQPAAAISEGLAGLARILAARSNGDGSVEVARAA